MAGTAGIVEGVRGGLAAIVDLLLPPSCMACGTPVATPMSLCAECWSSLPVIEAARCTRCAVPLPVAWQAEAECLGCLRDPPDFDHAAAPYLYDGPARSILLAMKHGRDAWAAPMARDMLRAAPDWASPGRLLIPVPLHRWRLAGRGYNQALLLARALAKAGGAALAPDWLQRVKPTPRTRGLGRAQRRRNVVGAFRLRPGLAARIKGAHVVLVDDVLTTGATASACARVLKRAGAARVDVLVYARVAATDATPYPAGTDIQEAHGQD